MNTVAMSIDIQIVQDYWLAEGTFDQQLLHIMRMTRQHASYTRDEQGLFQVALAVTLLRTPTGPDREWLDGQVQGLKDLSALLGGVNVDVEEMASQLNEREKRPYSLLQLWHQSKETA